MPSNFSSARLHLQHAFDALGGEDATSRRAREAIDLLIEAVATAEFARSRAVVIDLFSRRPLRLRTGSVDRGG
jgi:hypothetical protein